jgi:PAS domain S-box-containing protein
MPQLVSDNVTGLLGFTVDEACSLDWWMSHLHPEDRERAMAGIPEVLKTGTWNGEYRIRHKAGHYLWVEDQQQLVRNEAGRPIDIVGVWTNITERKLAETNSQQLTAIVESSVDAIIGMDLTGVVISWNRGAERMFGYAAGEMIGQAISQLVPPDRQQVEEHFLSRIRRGEVVTHFETVRLKKDGSAIEIFVTVSPIKDAAGKIVGASKVASDITERKRADKKNQDQFHELERWHEAMLGREERVLELKGEVNELLTQVKQPARYFNPDNL